MKYTFLFLFFSIIAASSSAQEKQNTDSLPCPLIEIDGPFNDKISVGQQLDLSVRRFKKKVEKSHTLSFQWELSNGIVVGDTKSRTVSIDTKDLLGQDISATVFVSGLEPNCPSSASITVHVVAVQTRTESRIIARPARN